MAHDPFEARTEVDTAQIEPVEGSEGELAEEHGREIRGITPEARTLLVRYSWPGNVRELEKVITRAVLMASDDDRIRSRHLSETLQRSEGAARPARGDAQRPLREQIADLEREAVKAALEENGWNRSAAARQLQVSYPTLLQKIRTFDLKES